jgi:hypothetical protein
LQNVPATFCRRDEADIVAVAISRHKDARLALGLTAFPIYPHSR